MANEVTREQIIAAQYNVTLESVQALLHDTLDMLDDKCGASRILALFAAHRDAEVEALRGLTEENTAWRERADEIAVKVGQLRAQLAALTEENAELRGPLTTKVRAADVVMKAIDDAVTRHYIDARSPIADARLDYGDPFKYTDDAFRARAETAEQEIKRLVLLDAERVGRISYLRERVTALAERVPAKAPSDGSKRGPWDGNPLGDEGLTHP